MTELDRFLNAFRDDLADARLKDRVAAPRYAEGRRAGIVHGVADLRRAPDAAAPLDSQLLYGERVLVFTQACDVLRPKRRQAILEYLRTMPNTTFINLSNRRDVEEFDRRKPARAI